MRKKKKEKYTYKGKRERERKRLCPVILSGQTSARQARTRSNKYQWKLYILLNTNFFLLLPLVSRYFYNLLLLFLSVNIKTVLAQITANNENTHSSLHRRLTAHLKIPSPILIADGNTIWMKKCVYRTSRLTDHTFW